MTGSWLRARIVGAVAAMSTTVAASSCTSSSGSDVPASPPSCADAGAPETSTLAPDGGFERVACYVPGAAFDGGIAPALPCLAHDDPALASVIAEPCGWGINGYGAVLAGPEQVSTADGACSVHCCYLREFNCTGRPLFVLGLPRVAPLVSGAAWA